MGAVPWVVMSEVIRTSKIIILNYDLSKPLFVSACVNIESHIEEK